MKNSTRTWPSCSTVCAHSVPTSSSPISCPLRWWTRSSSKATSSLRDGYSLTCSGGFNTKTSIQSLSTMSSERFSSTSMRTRRMSSIMMILLSSYLKILTEARSALLSIIIRDIFWISRVSVTLKTGLPKGLKHCNCIKYQPESFTLISTITLWIWKLNQI